MSTGALKLPALPPKSGCLVCGAQHGAESCPLNADIIARDPVVWRRVAEIQIRREQRAAAEFRLELLRRAAKPDNRSSDQKMEDDIGDGVAMQLRRMRGVAA